MSDLSTQLWQWFQERPKWLQEATRIVLQGGSITQEEIERLVRVCESEVGIKSEEPANMRDGGLSKALFIATGGASKLRLDKIADVQGINALAPRKPLEFTSEPITVVFGNNGAGKSGYTRILKRACGGRGPRQLHGNVFKRGKEAQACTFVFTTGETQQQVAWCPNSGALPELRTISLYDSDAAHVYVNNENEVAYEPSLLRCFRVLVEACEVIEKKLHDKMAAKPQRLPKLPNEFQQTKRGQWFTSITHNTTLAEIQRNCEWIESDEAELAAITSRLAEAHPAEKAKALRAQGRQIASLLSELENRIAAVSNVSFEVLSAARETAALKRKVARDDVQKIFANAPLGGIGSESWRLMWEQARAYSENVAYKKMPFPNLLEGSVCVLCQQSLSSDARDRLRGFESFIKGNLEREAVDAEQVVQTLIRQLSQTPTRAEAETKLDACGLTEESTRNEVLRVIAELADRQAKFISVVNSNELPSVESDPVLRYLAESGGRIEEAARAFEDDAKGKTRPELAMNARELGARKWVAEQCESVQDEVRRLHEIKLLKDAIKLTNTRALSDKKSSLAEELITKAFLQRFEQELAVLGASRLCVTIEKTKTTKGQVWHQIKLKDCVTNVRTSEVLSEGEFRVVSLAAFLADANVDGFASPFVFDDPISSLDQDFEEATAYRLVRLSESRQVIVFTHRLSLLAMLEDATERAATPIRIIALQKEPWGAGEPSGPPLPAQKPKAALNSLINDRLAKARKVWETEGGSAYAVEAKALCSDIRMTLERLVELELLADVVQRFRRPINTMGKIERLARIKLQDCTLIDSLMTKYSRYEHAQPREAPVSLPEPSELEQDLKALRDWLAEFSSRPVGPR